MDHDDTSADPTADDIASTLIGQLMREPDAARRYAAARILTERLPTVRAVSAKQLEIETGSMSAAADRLGVSRQYVDQLYRETDTPGPRADRGRADRPAHRYGRLLAVSRTAADLAEAAGDRHAVHAWMTLEPRAVQSVFVWPTMYQRVLDWLIRGAQKDRAAADAVRVRLDELGGAVGELSGHLSLAQQADVYLGYHAARARG